MPPDLLKTEVPIAAAVAGGRHFLTDRLYRGLIAACAVFLIFFAGYFAYAGIEKLNVLIAQRAFT